ncbi:glycosyltransferase family 2 protein, partial [Emergencia timonensis]|uniref:glycosyltransferase family 2 protein n=1 Tax=Emergencia timonensis TaxID=1776384 RepID=UPI00241F5784
MSNTKEKISIVVPCYNEEESLPLFYMETTKVLLGMNEVDYEFVFVNDGSSDKTLEIMKKLHDGDAHCRYVGFSRNFGKEAGMYAGLAEAEGDYCVIMDADLQHPPSLLKDMFYSVDKEGYDCCAGKRLDRTGEGKVRNFLSHSFYRVIQRLTHMDMSDGAGDFRMMSRQMVNAILEMKEYNRYMKGLFSFVGFETKWVEFHNVERIAGETKWTLRSLFAYACEGIFSFSTKPLMISGMFGSFLLVISFILAGYIGVDTLFFHHKFNGLLAITLLILVLSSIQMIFVSILGQYVSKDYMENKNRPI